MNKAVYFSFLISLLGLVGCVTQDRLQADRLDALGHPVTPTFVGDIRGLFEADLRQLIAERAQKDQAFKKLGHHVEQVKDEAYWDKFHRVFDGQPTGYSSATREEWKRNFRLSTETYVVWGEDGNIMILYFDGAGRLWQYAHL